MLTLYFHRNLIEKLKADEEERLAKEREADPDLAGQGVTESPVPSQSPSKGKAKSPK